MQHVDRWRPSKYVMRRGRLLPSNDRQELAVSSRLIGRLLVDRYQPALAAHARGCLLDLGCGKVPFHAAYRDFIEEAVCIDWPGSVHGTLHVDAFCNLASALPFTDGAFDTLLSSDVLEHLPDPVSAFKEMARVLRPGGMLLLNTPFFYMLHEVPHDYARYTRFSLQKLAADAGLHVITLEEIGGLGEVFADLAAKALSMMPGLGNHFAAMLQRCALFLGATPPGRRLRLMSAPRFPLGYFLVARKPDVLAELSTRRLE